MNTHKDEANTLVIGGQCLERQSAPVEAALQYT